MTECPLMAAKVSAWASILDHLARELDIIIVVSAGNYDHEPPGELRLLTITFRGILDIC